MSQARASRKPLIVAGLGARAHAAAVRALSESHNIPVMVTYKAKGVVPDRDVRFAGVFTNGALEQEVIGEADVIVTVGLDRVELLPRPWRPRQPIVEIDRNIDAALGEIASELTYAEWDTEALQRTIVSQRERLRFRSERLTPDAVVRIASAALPRARVTVDAGAHMFPATLLWPIDEPCGMLISNGLSTMGFALPAAIGAALLDRKRPVVALVGDGGLAMSLGELATLAREQLRVIVIVFNDRSLSLIDVKQRQRTFTRAGVELSDVDWVGVARGCGVSACRADTAMDLERALANARNESGPGLIDARIDASDYASIIRWIRG